MSDLNVLGLISHLPREEIGLDNLLRALSTVTEILVSPVRLGEGQGEELGVGGGKVGW